VKLSQNLTTVFRHKFASPFEKRHASIALITVGLFWWQEGSSRL